MTRPKANWKQIRKVLWERSDGFCEVSGLPLDFDTFDAHHRRKKGMGGTSRLDTDSLPNLLALDPGVHNHGPRSVHALSTLSLQAGWLLHQDADPAKAPVMYRKREWVVLLPDGGKVIVPS
jgi:hypothetical protein